MPYCLRLFAEVLGEVAASEFFVAIGCLEQRFAADVTARVVLRSLYDEVSAQDLCGGG